MKEVSTKKRIKISKNQKQILMAVLGTSLIVGVSLVFVVFFIKNINFNGKVIKEKDMAIGDFEKSIKNVGLCVDKDRDGKMSEEELRACNPKNVSANSVPNSLRHNMMVKMANNKDLEMVGRAGLKDCYDDNGNKLDYEKKYQEATTDEAKVHQLYLMKMCTALRVIPDALPAQENAEALMSSLNQIFILSGWEPESLAPNGSATNSSIPGIGIIPVSLSVQADSAKTLTVLSNIEKSIRTFDVSTATISWRAEKLELKAQAAAFYTKPVEVTTKKKTIYANDNLKKKKGAKK